MIGERHPSSIPLGDQQWPMGPPKTDGMTDGRMDRLRLRLRPSFLPCSIVVKGSVSSATDDDDREWIAAAPIHHRSLGCPLPPSLPSLSPCSPGEPALCKSNRTPTLIMSASKDQRTSDGRTDGRTDGGTASRLLSLSVNDCETRGFYM